MADLPDISHLTPEERRIIESVMMRQKQEEEQENEIMRRKQDEVQVLEETIRARSEKHKKAGVELNATCHICLKTKFADGVGHICNYCNIRCCARCGGKVTLRSNKVIWVCILCRKKQELLSKTGQWMTKTGLAGADSAMLRRMQEDMQMGGPQGLVDQTQDKRPKLERAHSAAEKENLPLLQRSGSLLRRQYSQQEQIQGRRMSTSDSGVEMSVSPHTRTLPTPHPVVSSYPAHQTPRHPAAYPEDDPSIYRGEIDGLMRQHQPNYQRQRQIYQDQNSGIAMTYGQTSVDNGPPRGTHPSQQHSMHQTQGSHTPQACMGVQGELQQQRSFSSSEEERSTPECASDEPDESEKGKGYYQEAGGGPMSMSGGGRRQNGPHNGHHVTGAMTIEYNGHHPPREPRKEENTLVRRSFRRNGDEWRADSRRFTERRGKKTVRFDGGTNVSGSQEDWSWEADRQGSQDSATKDSGIDTSSTFTSSEDSNRGDLPKHPLSWQVSRDGQKLIAHMVLRKSPGSGNSSSILGLKVVGGKLLEDGSMGALIEKVKKGSTADIEGQLRPGDEVIKWNGRSLQGKSFREVYDIIADSRQEPQVELVVSRNLSSSSGPPPSMPGGPTTTPLTPMATRRMAAQAQWRQKHETVSGPQHHKELYDARREKPSVLVTSPASPDLHGRGRHMRQQAGNASVGGDIQVKLGYDPVALQLIVTLICAVGLTPRSNGQPRNPYAKIFLLPDKSERSKKRTKTLANTNEPKWNQTFIYNGIRRSELRKSALEITVWDYARYDANDFLGEVVLDLGVSPLDDEPEWHALTVHAEHRHVGHYSDVDDMVVTPVDCHLSPPSTTSRLSDSDTSECDITDCDASREQRRTADGASISSIGSSSSHYSSPPPERDLLIDGEHRSRRDMSPQGRKRAALMISRDQPASISGYQPYRKEEIHRGMMSHRSHSAAPMDSPSIRYRGRSQSPTGHRSLSPPEHRSMPYSHGYMSTRFGSRSATATPTGSPKKRQLPQIPAALKERVAQDLEERARFIRHRNRQAHTSYRSSGMGGWDRHYSGLSDSDLPSIGHDPLSLPHSHAHRMHRPRRGHLSPDKDVLGDLGDSDMESIASVTSSAFSTQSERPRGSRGLIPTVKNVLIPGVISPMPPPPRRTRRRHRLRVPCSECHCPSDNPKPPRSGHPSKHTTTTTTSTTTTTTTTTPTYSHRHHPLVRSKSAVVRSLYRKMREPFTRSQTVDENLMRYNSPETSEYTVSEAYLLRPEELTAGTKGRIPEIYVEDCLRVDFDDRLVDKFRASHSLPYLLEPGARRRSRGGTWQDRTRKLDKVLRTRQRVLEQQQRPFANRYRDLNSLSAAGIYAGPRQRLSSSGFRDFLRDDLDANRILGQTASRPRRSLLFSKARSFDYDVIHNNYRAERLGFDDPLLSRRAKSFEYDTIPSNIFSDDSLRTARRKLKRNLSLSDSKYGDKIPALGDCSKSYYDSNGDDKPRRNIFNKKPSKYELLANELYDKRFYGYDSELSADETEIYLPALMQRNFDSAVNTERRATGNLLSTNTLANAATANQILNLEDSSKRKYMDTDYFEDAAYYRDGSSEKRTRNFEENFSDPTSDHIYCSIDEVLASSENYRYQPQTATRSRSAKSDDEMDNRIIIHPRRRTKSNESYLDENYQLYEPWDYDEDMDQYEEDYTYENNRDIPSSAGRSTMDTEYFDEPMDPTESTYRSTRNAQYRQENGMYTDNGYSAYPPTDNYEYSATHNDHEYLISSYEQDYASRRQRRARQDTADVDAVNYENVRRSDTRRMSRKNNLDVPTFAESKRMMIQRAESTPALYPDEGSSSSAERARRMYKRKRNSSCPETRDWTSSDNIRRRDEDVSSFMLESDDDFGSMETVVGAEYFQQKKLDEANRANAVRAEFYGGTESRTDAYVDSRSAAQGRVDKSYVDSRFPGHERIDSYVNTRYEYGDDRTNECSECRDMRGGARHSRDRRKSSCPECRELDAFPSALARSSSLSRKHEERRLSSERASARRRRNSSCPEARDLESFDEKRLRERGQREQQQQQPPSSKRNVAISDTLEYYEYSMESESQCSENCGFGPCDPRRPRNRAPRPGNANSNLFDSQTATSDTAKNHPRAVDHHENPRNAKPSNTTTTIITAASHRDDYAADVEPPSLPAAGPPSRRRSRKSSSAQRDYADERGPARSDDDDPDADADADARNRRSSSMPESSEYSSQSGSYEKPGRHQGTDEDRDDHGKRGQFTRSLSNADVPPDEKVDGSLSDTAVGLSADDPSRRGRKSSPGSKSGSGSSSGGGSAVQYQTGMGKKSNSTSQLSATECGLGGGMVFLGGIMAPDGRNGAASSSRKRNSTPSSIQRSEEIVPAYQRYDVGRQPGSAASDTAGSLNSISSSEGGSWSPSLRMTGDSGQLKDFIDDLGPGQIVGRQALGSRCLGEIQLSLNQKKGYLEVEVIRAKDLKAKQGSKIIPAPYVKVYLVNGKKCIAKAKTVTARKTLDPFYQQTLSFRENFRGCILQVTVWGDYGRLEGKKVFMGIAQIVLDELNNDMVFGWYKLFGTTSL